MCLIIAIIAFVFSYNYFIVENYMASLGSFIVALGFILFMIKNILYVKQLKSEKKNDS